MPLVQNFLPHDTMKIIKYKKNIRMDFKNHKLKQRTDHDNGNPLRQNFTTIFRQGSSFDKYIGRFHLDLCVIDWDNKCVANMLEDIESDEQYIMLNRLHTHKKFLTNFLTEVQTNIEPVCNMFGFHKYVKHCGHTCFEYNYTNVLSLNNFISSTLFDFETYDKINKATESEYFDDSDENIFKNSTFNTVDKKKKHQAQVWLAQDFPLQFDVLLSLLEVLLFLLPESVTSNMRNFIECQKTLTLLCKKD